MLSIMGVDQHGQTFHDLGDAPRKALMERLGYKRATKMYKEIGHRTYHIGYVIGPYWITLYYVVPFEKLETSR